MRHLLDTPTSNFIFFRSYSRFADGRRESWAAMVDRCVKGLTKLGKLTDNEAELIRWQMTECKALPSGRYMWCGGTDWSSKQENFSGSYNCSSTVVDNIDAFGYMMDLAMQGTGTGAVLELDVIDKLPTIKTRLDVAIAGDIGDAPADDRQSKTTVNIYDNVIDITVGDSRRGWVDSYMALITIATASGGDGTINVNIDLSSVRPKGEKLNGFGGVANPAKLPELYGKVAAILNGAIGRKLTSIECCMLIDEAALVIVAGSIRRSAGIRQFSSNDIEAADAKSGLWKQDAAGSFYMPHPERQALVMANHTRVFHQKPTLDECIDAVTKQYYTGEGAIQWAGEAVARCNVDLINNASRKDHFLKLYDADRSVAGVYLDALSENRASQSQIDERLARYGMNPCLAAGTGVVTRFGHFPIEALVGNTVDVWDGSQWVTVNDFRVTAENQQVYALHLSDGSCVVATGNHKFVRSDESEVELLSLKPGDDLKIHQARPEGMHTNRAMRSVLVVSVADNGIADKVYCCTVPTTHQFALSCGIMSHNCGEIIMNNNHCNLAEIHLNTINPLDLDSQVLAFKAASLSVAALLHHEFEFLRYQDARSVDPIVGVSFTGLFDFFVQLFGVDWLRWWQAGRPKAWGNPVDINKSHKLFPLLQSDFIRVHHFDTLSDLYLTIEEEYLCLWRQVVTDVVTEYCDRHNLKCPNRCTTVQPAGSKSLLTGASPGWHPPKASRYIRRMTFGKGEPLALAAIDMGYSVIPSSNDKDSDGNLLDDIHDPRCTEWLVEIPCQTIWADLPGVDEIEIGKFSALAQFDFYMQVQKYYTVHNTSATIELREDEIEPLATAIYDSIQGDEGYMSAALLARFDSLETFPRLPFEPIDEDTYDDMMVAIAMRSSGLSFDEALALHDQGQTAESGPSGCDSDKCLMPERKPNS